MNSEINLKYLANPNQCPYCDSIEIWAENTESAGDQVWRTVACDSCNKDWREVFKLSFIEDNN